jgi:RHS repeat-associated protein
MRMVDSNVQTGFVLDSTRYTYDWDGATTRRIRVDLNAGTTVDEKFKYSYRDLLRRYTASPGGTVIAQDWRYRYNPFGEREQKRMYYMGIDTLGAGYQHPWVYYLLGGSKEQLAVWHGLETCDPMCSDTGQRVYMYPVEYLTFGSGTAKVITQPDGVQQYKLSDHLGTSRAVVVSTGSTISETDYEPFGEPIPVSGSVPRLSYIDKEGDFENKLGDYGVRKYDAKIGRFLSNDDLWESNPSMSAYIYVGDDPVNGVDPTGFEERPGFNVKNNAPSEIVLIGGQGRESLNQGDIFEPILNEDGSRTGRIYRKNGRIDNVQLHDVDGVQIQSGQIFRINGAYDVSLNNVEEQGDSDFGPYHIKIHNSVIQRVFGGATGVGTLEIDPSDERTLKLSQTGIFPWSITILPPTVRKGQSARPIGSPPRGQKIPDGL